MSSYTPPTSPTSPSSYGSGRSFSAGSGDYLLPMTSPTPSNRTAPLSSSRPKAHKVNANSYCGRHSDEYLFGPIADSASRIWHNITKKE
ncbi:hypothetical protein QBC34DRAFT_373581 [Podospora aff. communis PSN243]|uniref:Uncharacterized protein n=1 Tax=Podospora aff. communis PSN243 TaxID=3040156 RepID=A0AAV9H6C3_9PEZI|nr:hypothetical protein QBC34DRAFT_373581 [Podospora aff. communis PSN243]